MEKAELLIKEAGLRPTKARVAVLATISHARSALSHSDILSLLEGNREFDRVTIYRVLDWLVEHGLIHKVLTDNRSWKFQSNIQPNEYKVSKTHTKSFINGHAHAHLQCEHCGALICVHEFQANIPDKLIKQYQISTIEVNLKGICTQCQTSH
jgi:Fur family ferric uptake transcriptional regulator